MNKDKTPKTSLTPEWYQLPRRAEVVDLTRIRQHFAWLFNRDRKETQCFERNLDFLEKKHVESDLHIPLAGYAAFQNADIDLSAIDFEVRQHF